MAVIGWGKPRIFYKSLSEGGKWQEFATPAEGTTSLATTKGDKTEAKVEGGANEDVKYNKNTYALTFNLRAAKGRKRPVEDVDGIITENYAIVLQPEDPNVPGFAMEKTTASVEDTYSAADGGAWAYTFDALIPEVTQMTTIKQVQWGVIEVTGTGDEMEITLDKTPVAKAK